MEPTSSRRSAHAGHSAPADEHGPTQSDHTHADPTQADPAPVDLAQTHAAPTDPADTDLTDADAADTDPTEAGPAETDRADTGLAEADRVHADAARYEPPRHEPTRHEPTEHEPEQFDTGRESMPGDPAPPIEARYLRGRPSPRPRFTPDPEPAPPPQSRAAGVAKVTGLITASAALCAAITTAALTSDRQESQSISGTSRSAELTGVRALDPQAAAGYAPAQTSTRQTITSTTTSSAAPPAKPSNPPPPGSPLPSSSSLSSSSGTSARVDVRSAASPEEVLSFVHTFYRLLGANPRDALRLVDPALVEDEGDDLVRSWEDVEDVRVGNIDLREGNRVLAEVSMRESDGAQLRLRQLLRLSGPRDPLITEAQVLSVHRD